jgi:hypothetical protein
MHPCGRASHGSSGASPPRIARPRRNARLAAARRKAAAAAAAAGTANATSTTHTSTGTASSASGATSTGSTGTSSVGTGSSGTTSSGSSGSTGSTSSGSSILLQGLWAGLFIREGKDFDATSAQSNWVGVHDWGARVAIVLALASLVVAVRRLRVRKDLLLGTSALLLLLLLEAYIGGAIAQRGSWPSFHIPLAMALMALSVWLPSRAARTRRVPGRHD